MTETSLHLPLLSVVVPVRNEVGNLERLLANIEGAYARLGAFEVLFVNDGSTDGMAAALAALATSQPWLKIIAHARSCGQSAAVRRGARHDRAPIFATLEGDGQNDPAFLPAMLKALQRTGIKGGHHVGRKDTGFKKLQSIVANGVRGCLLKNQTRDAGCRLKCFGREAYLALPYFDRLHRFMPALIVREGSQVVHRDVRDPRVSGTSHYSFFDRLWVGILDLVGYWWLIHRRKRVPQVVKEMQS